MGNTASKEALFIKEIKSMLRERGIRVKKKDLLDFFCYVEEICPWLVLSGPDIHPLTWNKVGKDINEVLRQGREVPESFFSFYGVIRDILKESDSEGKVSHLLALAEDFINEREDNREKKNNHEGPLSDKMLRADEGDNLKKIVNIKGDKVSSQSPATSRSTSIIDEKSRIRICPLL